MERSAIHLLHKRGKSGRQIARELGFDRETVARVLKEGSDPPPLRRVRTSQVDPYREQITAWVKQGLTAVRMLELARADSERPYAGGHSVFRVAVQQERARQQQADAVRGVPVRFEGLPGEYLQVDWGEVPRFPFRQQARAKRYFLACRLKYSRWMWVRFTHDMRQETLLRGLVDGFLALGWVPWVLVFDNMKTVTSGRDAQGQPIWTPALRQLAGEFGFHPEACTPGAANQKGTVESLVKFVKGNFLAGREFSDDADLAQQQTEWLALVNTRPSRATDRPPQALLADEAAQGGGLPATASDYGFLRPGQVSRESLVAVEGNQYSVPIAHVGAPVTVRLHRTRVVLWRDTEPIAEHERAPDGAHRRVVIPEHFSPLFGRKPRAQVMLYRQALLELGEVAIAYVTELSRRQRARLTPEILGLYELLQQHGSATLLAAMDLAQNANAYGVEYLAALIAAPRAAPFPFPDATLPPLLVPGAPGQAEIDRQLELYEVYVHGALAPAAEVPA
jgi:transposase